MRKVFTQIFSFINVQLFNRYMQSKPISSCLFLSLFILLFNEVTLQMGYHSCAIYQVSSFYTFCSLLLRRECCSFSNGEYVKTGLAELEQWCYEATSEVSIEHSSWFLSSTGLSHIYLTCFSLQFVGSAWDELKHIRQAVGFLVILVFIAYLINS